MRVSLIVIVCALLVNGIADTYIYMALRSEARKRIWSRIQLWSAIALTLALLSLAVLPLRTCSEEFLRGTMWGLYAYITIYIGKYVYCVLDIISRIPILFHGHRAKWLSRTGLFLGLATFILFWWGALFNRFNLQTNEVQIVSPEIPKGFDGFTIAQISDLHLGTYGTDTTFICDLVGEINSLHPDIVVFTGDIVNRKSDELRPFVAPLSRLKAHYGVYSILGNHDYGDYVDWRDEKDKDNNLRMLKEMQAEMGWRLLNNESKDIVLNGDTLVLIGVENIGDPPFHSYGSLDKAYADPGNDKVKVLLSHNPSHWEEEIKDNPDNNILLTLSGHTHAMQFELLGLSPVAFRYDYWGGLYRDSLDHRIYVNIGAGTVGFPARIGATPEISLFTLRRGVRR